MIQVQEKSVGSFNHKLGKWRRQANVEVEVDEELRVREEKRGGEQKNRRAGEDESERGGEVSCS
jgi:hypothetical protein